MPKRGRLRNLWDASVYLGGREATLLLSAIAFSFMVSIFPFIVLLLTLSHYLNWKELRETIFDAFYVFFPISQDFIIRNLKIYTESVGGLHIVSFLLLAWGVSAFFFSLEAGLDSAYRVPNYRKFSRSQVLGTLMAIGFGAGVFAFIALFRAIHVLSARWVTLSPREVAWIDFFSSTALAFVLTLLTFLVIYRWLPNRPRTIRQVFPETLAATVTWLAGNAAFRASLPLWSLKDIYGPFHVSITLLFWAFSSAMLVLFFARIAEDGFFRRAARDRVVESPPTPEPHVPEASEGASSNL